MELLRYNTLRKWADVVIDLSSSLYQSAGVLIASESTIAVPPESMQFGTRIFIKTDLLPNSINFLGRIKKGFHLLTGSSDLCVNDNSALVAVILQNEKLLSWAGTNLVEQDPRMLSIPIGFEERERERSNKLYQYVHCKNGIVKDIDILLPFIESTHASRNILKNYIFENKLINVYVQRERLNFEEYINQLRRSKYVLCPRGNGMDTLRIYETILAGSIPLIEYTKLWKMHKKFGLILRSWNELSTIPPNSIVGEYSKSLLGESYWLDKVYSHQLQCTRTDKQDRAT